LKSHQAWLGRRSQWLSHDQLMTAMMTEMTRWSIKVRMNEDEDEDEDEDEAPRLIRSSTCP